MEGLSLGCGDAVIGLNPVDDSVESVARILKMFDEFKRKWEVPTQICVLAHVTTQTEAANKFGAPLDLMFQSIAGSQKGNEAFGLNAAMLDEGRATMLSRGTCTGPNVMYFETGQGSELSSEAHNGWDQVTMEARCYGFAKRYNPFLVNTVVGFIGPEYLYDSKQVTRAGLEDHFMGKLTGIPMGCDACYTNHMKADQNDIENLATLLVAAGCNYIMGVPAGDDCMLMYQCTGYHEAAALREVFGLRPIHEFDMWLEKMGFSENGKLTPKAGDASVFRRSKEERRMDEKDLRSIIEQVLTEMNVSGAKPAEKAAAACACESAPEVEDGCIPDITEIDIRKQYLVKNPENGEEYAELKMNAPCRLGIGKAGARYNTLPQLEFRAAHSAAQDAVFNDVDAEFVEKMGLWTVQTQCDSKDTYLTRPDLGRKLSPEAVETIKAKCKKNPTVQIYVADGLSSAAVAANIGDLLPAILQGLESYKIDVGTPFFVKYGRVGVMDEISELTGATVTCTLIGERPGLITAESMSAYIAYKATVGMPEARRTVVSNIHRAGTIPAEAGAHIAEIIKIMLDKKASGTDLKL